MYYSESSLNKFDSWPYFILINDVDLVRGLFFTVLEFYRCRK